MSAKDLVDRVWELIEAGDLDAMEELMQPDVELRGLGLHLTSRAEVRGMVEGYLAAFPDLHHETIGYVESGDRIALELRVTGTNTGPMHTPQGEVPATGRAAVWESSDHITVRDGKFASWHVYNDQLAFLV